MPRHQQVAQLHHGDVTCALPVYGIECHNGLQLVVFLHNLTVEVRGSVPKREVRSLTECSVRRAPWDPSFCDDRTPRALKNDPHIHRNAHENCTTVVKLVIA